MLTIQSDAPATLRGVPPWPPSLGKLEGDARDSLRSGRTVRMTVDDALILCASASRAPASREQCELHLERFESYLGAPQVDDVELSAGYVLQLVQVARGGCGTAGPQ